MPSEAQVRVTPRERIRQAEEAIQAEIAVVLRDLKADIDMVPTDVEVEMIATGPSYLDLIGEPLIGRVKLRF